MNTEIIRKQETLPLKRSETSPEKSKKPEFVWKTKDGRYFSIKQMSTSHLFNTIRMIWHHKMPKEAALGEYQKYDFGTFYSKEYLELAIRKMLPELIKRSDNREYIKDINKMWSYLQKNRKDLLK